jgi:hypothetical protein
VLLNAIRDSLTELSRSDDSEHAEDNDNDGDVTAHGKLSEDD